LETRGGSIVSSRTHGDVRESLEWD